MPSRRLSKWAVGPLAAGLLVASCGTGASTNSSGTAPTGGTKKAGGTVTWAELPPPIPGPNFIYPFDAPGFFSVANINQLQYMMYRPLYWFGNGNRPTLDDAESLAQRPAYSGDDKTVTITLKPYKWSDGETLSSTDVMEWVNIWHAEKQNWPAYVPNVGMPDDIAAVTIAGPTQLTIQLTTSANPTWLTYDNLSQITPLPAAWDITQMGAAPGSGNCAKGTFGAATTDAACTAVWNFMTTQAGYSPALPSGVNSAIGSYATNPLWQVVDGPWRLSGFDPNGTVTLVPNRSYSGPRKPTISKFVEVPFNDPQAELNALLAGQLTMGYLPISAVPGATTNPLVPSSNLARLARRFYVVPQYPWSINYIPYNFNSTGDNGVAGKIFGQSYFRQAMQMLVNQPAIIKSVYSGYGVPVYGPVPLLPSSPFVSKTAKANPYPYNPTKAKALLSSHGWTVVPGGVDTCTRPGTGPTDCGAGIAQGDKLDLDLEYTSGVTTMAEALAMERSAWASAGIHVDLSTASFDTVIANAVACTPGPSCSWQLEYWGAGWLYSPDVYPTGEQTFMTGAAPNYGSYSDPMDDQNIVTTTMTNAGLFGYEDYLARQLPVLWQPTEAQYLWEISDRLRGASPVNALQNADPEYYYFVK